MVIHRILPPFSINVLVWINKNIGKNPDWVVHTHATAGVSLAFTRRIRTFGLFSHVHGTSRSHFTPIRYRSGRISVDYSSTRTSYHMLREKTLWSSADRVLTVSNATSRDVIDYYGIDSGMVRTVYNGVDTQLFRPSNDIESPAPLEELSDRQIVLFVGHFGLRKGIFFLIRAMRQVVASFPRAHLVCVGGVPEWLGGKDYWEVLEREIAANGVGNNVTLLDAVENRELVAYYAHAQLLALPSYYESFSKVTAEAMACGLPVVATKSGGLEEVVEDGKTGILVRYGSVLELAKAIETLLRDEDLRHRMGAEGRRKVESMFTWSAVVERITHAYEEAHEKRP